MQIAWPSILVLRSSQSPGVKFSGFPVFTRRSILTRSAIIILIPRTFVSRHLRWRVGSLQTITMQSCISFVTITWDESSQKSSNRAGKTSVYICCVCETGFNHSFVLPYPNVTTKSVQCPVARGSDNRGRSGKGPLSVPPEYFVQIVSIMSKSAVLQQ